MCNSGYHVVDNAHLLDFLGYGYHIYEVDVRGECLAESYKSCHQQARLLRELQWGEMEARLFACDCADRALDMWAKNATVDPRSRAAVDVARRYAVGDATNEEQEAALAAAWDAAWDAARAAAWAAERRWQNARLLDYLYGRT
jgi:hypothetical protein